LVVLGTTLFTQELGGIRLSKTTYEPNMIMRAHAHDYPYVSLVLEGRYTEHTRESPRHLRRNMLVFHPAGEVHADCVHDQSMATINLEYVSGRLPQEFICAEGPEVDALTHRFLSAVPESGRRLRNSIEAIRDFLWSRTSRSQPSEEMVRARETLLERDCRCSVSALAAELGVNRVLLHRAFKRAYGQSPRAGVTGNRLAAAAKLLTGSDETIATIAAECGYYDQSHFCRQFKAFAGMSPSGYRRAFAI
jgi:AraC family transcriptional regulator